MRGEPVYGLWSKTPSPIPTEVIQAKVRHLIALVLRPLPTEDM